LTVRSLLATLALVLVVAPPASARGLPSFTGGPLPHDPAVAVPRNRDYEPGMSVAPDGSIWIAANVQFIDSSDDPRDAVVSGEDVWHSTDDGRTFRWVADPADLTGTNAAPGPGGGDTDIAAATAFNAGGGYDVYTVTSWAGSATVGVSRDAGRTWSSNPVAIPPHDRPWIAADGACVYYVTYRAPASPTGEVVQRRDVCDASDTAASATAVPPSPASVAEYAGGKPVVDASPSSRYRHRLYVPMIGCAGTNGTGYTGCAVSVDMGVSADGGRTFTTVHVGDSPGRDPTGVFPMVAADAAGTVYAMWDDWQQVFFSVSRDGGAHWTPPRLVDTSPSESAALSQIAAGRAGEIALAWYGSGRAGDVRVYVARSRDGGRSFESTAATPVAHVGPVCSSTSSCSDPNGGDLRDDFGIVVSPRTHRVTVAYTSDRPEGDRPHDFVAYATQRY
jgi:hypothetical protein